MDQDSQDVAIAQVQNILRVAHSLQEVIAPFTSSHYSSMKAVNSLPSSDSINLPSPSPLVPALLGLGVSDETAYAASKMYLRHAEELKLCIRESIASACREAAEFPASTSILPPDLLMKKMTSIFTRVYVKRLDQWKRETIQRIQQAQQTLAKTARNPRNFNHEYVPLLEHFFEETPFPTHADKMFLARKSNMQYRQIHVWFQNRRNRSKKDGRNLRRNPIYQKSTRVLCKLYEDTNCHMISDFQAPEPFKVSSEGPRKTESARNEVSKDTFPSFAPHHAFPSPYPPICHYDPFPCKNGLVHFSKPEWRRSSCEILSPPPSISIDELVNKFSQLNVRDETRYRGSPKPLSHAATAAITIIPSPAPHPSLLPCKYRWPANTVERHPIVRASVPSMDGFRSSNPVSKPVTLVPSSSSLGKNELSRKRKIAPLPRRFPGRIRETCRDTSPEVSSTSSSSPCLFSPDLEGRSCSLTNFTLLPTQQT